MLYSKVKCTPEKAKKRSCEDDIPPAVGNKTATQLKAYKQLEATVWCEFHCGHFFIDCTNRHDNHCWLDHSEMSLWAKNIVSHPCSLIQNDNLHDCERSLGQATIYNSPHCLNFNCGLSKKHHQSMSMPEVHITIQNITPDAITASTSHTSSARYMTTPSPPPLSQPHNLCNFVCCDTPIPNHNSPAPVPTLAPAAPPLYDYASITQVLELIEADKPGQEFSKLEDILQEAGVVSASQVVLTISWMPGTLWMLALSMTRTEFGMGHGCIQCSTPSMKSQNSSPENK